MKKQKFPVVLVILLFVFGFGGFILILQAAEIVFTEGSVQMQSTDKVWKKAEQGMKVNIGDSIRTARKSRADLVLDEAKKNAIRIDEKTLVVLNSTEPGQINKIDLSNGKIYSNVENVKAGMAFEISTPSSVAGVRGTGWSVMSTKNNDEVATFKDTVSVKSFDANKNLISETTVPEGFKTQIDRFQAAGALTALSMQERQHWDAVKQNLTQNVENPPAPAPKTEGGASGENLENITDATQLQQDIAKDVGSSKESIEDRKTEETTGHIRELGGHSEW